MAALGNLGLGLGDLNLGFKEFGFKGLRIFSSGFRELGVWELRDVGP